VITESKDTCFATITSKLWSASLGSIYSLALVTMKAVRAIGLQLAGWVANQIDPQMTSFDENVHTLTQRLNCPLLGVLPFEQNINAKKFSVFLDIAQLD